MEALQSQLLPQLERGRPTQRENLHLTLAFLGDVAPSHVPALRGILKELQQTPAFSLCFDRIGTFGGKQPVLYLAPQSSPILFAFTILSPPIIRSYLVQNRDAGKSTSLLF